jgi:hypothetical protein
MSGGVDQFVNPLEKHGVYVGGNMVNILETIPIEIAKTHSTVDNIFISVDCSPEEIHAYNSLFKEFHGIFF